MFSIIPLSFDAPSPSTPATNIRKNLTVPITRVTGLHLGRCKYSSIFIQIFVMRSERRICFETECTMALQGHPRSLILAPIESAYATSYRSSIVTLVLSCPVWEIVQFFCWEERPTPISPECWGGSPWIRLPMLWLRAAKKILG